MVINQHLFSFIIPSESLPEPVCDCWQCWLILQTVCPACSLLSAILAFVCGYRCCHKTGEIYIYNLTIYYIQSTRYNTVYVSCSSMFEGVIFLRTVIRDKPLILPFTVLKESEGHQSGSETQRQLSQEQVNSAAHKYAEKC